MTGKKQVFATINMQLHILLVLLLHADLHRRILTSTLTFYSFLSLEMKLMIVQI